jgi:hypothetical protein
MFHGKIHKKNGKSSVLLVKSVQLSDIGSHKPTGLAAHITWLAANAAMGWAIAIHWKRGSTTNRQFVYCPP